MSSCTASKTVLVIGTGPSGLVALKEMKEAGHTVIAVDKQTSIGGIFSKSGNGRYEGLQLTTSNLFGAFSDFPPLEDHIKYQSAEEYCNYLEAYVDHFGLGEHIKLETSVTSALFDSEQDRWVVDTMAKNGEKSEHIVDALVVATGAYQTPYTPDNLSYENTGIKTIHSSEYESNHIFKEKNVLVVGAGESAIDIAAEAAKVCRHTVLYSRSPFACAPRFPFIACLNKKYDEENYCQNDNKVIPACDYLETLATNRIGQSLPLYSYALLRRLLFRLGKTGIFGKNFRLSSLWALYGANEAPLKSEQGLVICKNGRLSTCIARGDPIDVIVSDKIVLGNNEVHFPKTRLHTDKLMKKKPLEGIKFHVDIVVCCTGFKASFHWLDNGKIQCEPRTWYKHCFVPGYGGKLMILGHARPHQGGIPATSEMLSRYGAMLVSGKRSLPKNYVEIARKEGDIETLYFSGSPHVTSLVDYSSFMRSLSQHVGCVPKTPSLIRPWNIWKFYFFADFPCWYRQRGPGANPKALKQTLSKCPVWSSTNLAHTGGFFFAEFLALLLCLPFYLLSFMVLCVSKIHNPGMTPGWMFTKPKVWILHGEGKAGGKPIKQVSRNPVSNKTSQLSVVSRDSYLDNNVNQDQLLV